VTRSELVTGCHKIRACAEWQAKMTYICVFCNQQEKKFRHTIIFEGDEIIGGTHAEEI